MNEKLKKYAQFMSVSDYETLIENMRKQRQLCKRIQELQVYRSHYGLTKLSDIEQLNKDKQAKQEQQSPTKTRKRKRKLFQALGGSGDAGLESPSKRLTRRQQHNTSQLLFNSSQLKALDQSKTLNTSTLLNETNLTDLNVSNIRNFSNTSSTSSSSSSGSRSRSDSTNSMNMYELVEPDAVNKSVKTEGDFDDLISDDEDEEDQVNEEAYMSITKKTDEQIFTDEEDEVEMSEDLSSGGAASSGGSGINEPDNITQTASFDRKLRQLSNRRSASSFSMLTKNKKLNLSLTSTATKSSNHKQSLNKTTVVVAASTSCRKFAARKKLMQRSSRTERLCSMPGYNLLSENEKKVLKKI